MLEFKGGVSLPQILVNFKFEVWRNFEKQYFHAKSKVKNKKYPKVKFHTSLKRCGHAESKF